ncbi:sodium-dependent phosphate transport protein 2C [Dermacentor silvarum]|uniref:sodium-dependent phosphate transport protein 2C n=1 Tax=Dermacentor silvarum TaxID=543639 RepID=UPI002101B4D5|nr:sodium-dependent phosphate transport protein 2C [Dermacentor silvarum]
MTLCKTLCVTDETCSESSGSLRARSECPASRSIGRPSSSGTQSRPGAKTAALSHRRSNDRQPTPTSEGPAAALPAASRTLRPAPSTNTGRDIRSTDEARSTATNARPAQRAADDVADKTVHAEGTSARGLPSSLEAAKEAAVRRSSDPATVQRATPRAGLVAARTSVDNRGQPGGGPPTGSEVLSQRLTIPSFFEQPPTPDVLRARRPAAAAPTEVTAERAAVAKAEGGEGCEATFSSVLSVRSLLQVEDPDVSNRQPDDREEGSAQFVVSMVGKMAVLLVCWYLFLVSLDLLSSAFKLFAGHQSSFRGPKSDVIRNPVVGIMTGLLVTVLVQSSSSSTSITISLVGSQPFLESSSRMAVEALDRKHRLLRYNHLRALTRPLTSFIIQLEEAKPPQRMTAERSDSSGIVINTVRTCCAFNGSRCVRPCQNALARLQLSDQTAGLVLLFFSLLLLLGCLSLLARTLSPALRLQVALSRVPQGLLEGYACLCLGLLATLVMQSSTALSSTLALLAASAGDRMANLQRAYPVLVGANIGTTSTGLLAALAGDPTPETLQLALCHSFFNVYGALLFYPVPFMRFPLPLAQLLAATAAQYRWFAVAYLLLVFLTLPLLALVLSFAGSTLFSAVGVPLLLVALFLVALNTAQRHRPHWLPPFLRSWAWLPLWMHSLAPLDALLEGHVLRRWRILDAFLGPPPLPAAPTAP